MVRTKWILLLLGLIPAPPAPGQEIDTLALRDHTRVLAHDSLEGRGTGTRGAELAARYIASQLERLGLSGAGRDGSYFQPIPLEEAVLDPEGTRLVLRRGAERLEFRSGEHFVVNTGGAGAFRSFAGEALFAGTAGLAAQALADRPSLKGQVIVILGGVGAEATTLIPDWIRRGAEAAVFLVPEPERFGLIAHGRGDTRLYVQASIDDPVWQPDLPILIAGPRLAAGLLADAPLAPDALDGTRPFTALPLGRSLEFSIRHEVRTVQASNVAGLLPGRDPAARDEVVVYTAHYDHLGIDAPDQRGDSIYNGFSDNAAGVAMLLAIAEAMAKDPPARSVLFLFLAGEEKGLLGSSYYAAFPLVALERTVAVINLDAGAPPAPPRSWRIAGGRESTLGELAAHVAASRGWVAEPSAARPNSDHWPFLRRRVPAVFLIPGQDWEGVAGVEREKLHQRWDRYHRPDDEWAPDFPFAGLQRYAELALALGRAVANSPERPRMLPDP